MFPLKLSFKWCFSHEPKTSGSRQFSLHVLIVVIKVNQLAGAYSSQYHPLTEAVRKKRGKRIHRKAELLKNNGHCVVVVLW